MRKCARVCVCACAPALKIKNICVFSPQHDHQHSNWNGGRSPHQPRNAAHGGVYRLLPLGHRVTAASRGRGQEDKGFAAPSSRWVNAAWVLLKLAVVNKKIREEERDQGKKRKEKERMNGRKSEIQPWIIRVTRRSESRYKQRQKIRTKTDNEERRQQWDRIAQSFHDPSFCRNIKNIQENVEWNQKMKSKNQ